jgi:hypothetical protein
MVKIQSHLDVAKTFSSFFGPLTLEPGTNPTVDEKRWNNCKKFNQDVQILLKKELLQELNF